MSLLPCLPSLISITILSPLQVVSQTLLAKPQPRLNLTPLTLYSVPAPVQLYVAGEKHSHTH